MTISRKPWISASSARTAGRCDPAWRRKTPRLYPAIISTGGFTSGFGTIFPSSTFKKILLDLHLPKNHCSLYTLAQFVDHSTIFRQFANIAHKAPPRRPTPEQGTRCACPAKPHTAAHRSEHELICCITGHSLLYTPSSSVFVHTDVTTALQQRP